MGGSVQLTRFLSPATIWLDVDATTKSNLLAFAGLRLSEAIEGMSGEDVCALLAARERVASTGVGEGIAIPHATCAAIDEPLVALIRLRNAIDFDAVDRLPVALIVVVLAPRGDQALHLRLLARIARLFRSAHVRESLLAATTVAAAYSMIAETENKASS